MNSDAIRNWVAQQLGLPVIWANPNAPRPKERPYAVVAYRNGERVGREFIKTNLDDTTTITGERLVVFGITVVDDAMVDPRRAFDLISSLRDSLELVSVRSQLRSGGWVLQEILLMGNVPGIVDTRWEPRAVLDVAMRGIVSQVDDLGVVEIIEGEATVQDRTQPFTISAPE